MSDNVNTPSHYTSGGIETIDFMRAKANLREFVGHCKLTAIKYISRAGKKGEDKELEDLEKAYVYIGWAIQELHGGDWFGEEDEQPIGSEGSLSPFGRWEHYRKVGDKND